MNPERETAVLQRLRAAAVVKQAEKDRNAALARANFVTEQERRRAAWLERQA